MTQEDLRYELLSHGKIGIAEISTKMFDLIEAYVKMRNGVFRGTKTYDHLYEPYKALCKYIAELEKDY